MPTTDTLSLPALATGSCGVQGRVLAERLPQQPVVGDLLTGSPTAWLLPVEEQQNP